MMDLSLANAVSASNAVPSFINSGFTSKAEYDKFASLRGGGPEFAEPECLGSVAAFHRLFKAHVVSKPAIPDAKRCALRVSLLQEELNEMKEAIEENDLVEIADALADIQYVLAGAVHEFGLGSRFGALFDEVQRSNMSKACTTREEAERTVTHYAAKDQPAHIEEVGGKFLVYRTADNKVLKSVEYSPADLKGILGEENIPAKKQKQ